MPVRTAFALAAPAAALLAGWPASASETDFNLAVSARATADENPFLLPISDAGALVGEVSIRPTLKRSSPTSAFELAAHLSSRQYSRLYDGNTVGSGRVSGSVRTSERLQFSGNASYSYDVGAQLIDEAAAGLDPQSGRSTMSLDLAAQLRLSELIELRPTLSLQKNSYSDSDLLGGFGSYSTGFGYHRRISPYTSIGVRTGLQLNRSDFGTSNIVSLLLAADTRLSPTINASGTIGVERSHLDFDRPGFPEQSDTRLSLTGNGQVCRAGLWLTLCATAGLASRATGVGPLQRQLTTGASLSYRTGEFSRLTGQFNYGRLSSSGTVGLPSYSYLSAQTRYEMGLNKSLTLGAFTTYQQRSGIDDVGAASAGLDLRWTSGRE